MKNYLPVCVTYSLGIGQISLVPELLLYKSFPNLLCRWHIWATRVLGLTNNYQQPAWGEGIM